MKAWQVSFILLRDEWAQAEGMLSDAFHALTVKPIRENDNTSPEEVCLIFAEEVEATEAAAQLTDLFDIVGVTLPEIKIDALPDIDWLQHVYETLKPIEAGSFFVHGSHITQDFPPGKTAIIIEAASGFGTGEHPTTKGCLLVLDKYLTANTPNRVLDMGCGSGILSIAVAKIVSTTQTILGVDIHNESVRVSKAHADANNVGDKIDYVYGDGFHAPEVGSNAPYDLVLANILAQPLIEMAPHMTAVATRDIILSGFTTEQRSYVETPYAKAGFMVQEDVVIDGWVALWLRKK